MSTTSHLALTLVETAQAQKEVTVNAALSKIDAILNTGAKDKDLATPPGSPAEGDVYIVAGSPTGTWSGQAKAIAYYNSGWKFIVPAEGMSIWVNDENLFYSYDGSAWQAAAGAAQGRQAVTASGTIAIDLKLGTVVDLAQAVDITTFTFTNPAPSGTACRIIIIRTKDATGTARAITWPTGTKWQGGSPPALTQTTGAIDIFEFLTVNGGSNWYGRTIGTNFS